MPAIPRLSLSAPGASMGRRGLSGRVGRTLELPREMSGVLDEGWLRVSSGLTSGSVGGPGAAGPGPGGQQQEPRPATTDEGGPRALGVHCQQRCGPSSHLHKSLCAGLVAREPAGDWRKPCGTGHGESYLEARMGMVGGRPWDDRWMVEALGLPLALHLPPGPCPSFLPPSLPSQAPAPMESPMCLWCLCPRVPMSPGSLALMVATCRDSVSGIPPCE